MITQFRHWSWLKKIIFSSFVLAIIAGVIAGVITPFFFPASEFVLKFVLANLGWVITLIIFFIIALSIILLGDNASRQRIEVMSNRLIEVGNEINELTKKIDLLNSDADKSKQLLLFVEHSLLQRLPDVLSAQDRADLDKKMYEFMKDFLADATVLTPKVYASSLFLPADDQDWLTIWVGYQVPEDSKILAKCYIGPDAGRKRGIAGKAHVQGNIEVGRLKQQENGWRFDNDDYIHFPKSSIYPPFMSLACVPIVEAPSQGGLPSKPLGALCFDSESIDSFDSPAVQDVLKQLGHFTASVLLLYDKLREKHSS
jgi:hypothetical protein